jgi:catechol 2,3-dioxygenase-like lactoylglutathione lyase family enzyme
MSPSLRLDHVLIAAPRGCEDEARRFYGALLGLPELQKPEPLPARGGVWFGLGDGQLHIGVQEPFVSARKAHPAFRWTDAELHAVAKRLAEAGAPVLWDKELPDVRRFFTEDPWGNRLELLAPAEGD